MVTLQAENFSTLNNYIVETISGLTVIKIGPGVPSGGTATATTAFTGSAGTYAITVTYLDENDGVGQLELLVDGVSVGTLTLDSTAGNQQGIPASTWTLNGGAGIYIPAGASIEIIGTRANGEYARVDSIDFTLLNSPPTGSATGVIPNTAEDIPLVIAYSTLTTGFTDPDSNPLVATGLSANNGTITDNGDGTFTYTPDPNYNGPVTLTYSVSDGNGGSINNVTLGFTVTPVNDSPTGNPTGVLTDTPEDTPILINVGSLTAGFSDVDGDILLVTGLTADAGNAVDNGDGTFTYTPVPDYNGPVTLTYTISDGNGGTLDNITRSFNVTPVNDLPIVQGSLSLNIQTGTTGTLTTSQLTATDSDTPPASILYTVVGGLNSGVLELSTAPGVAITSFTQADLAAGQVVYVHNGADVTTDSIQLAVDDSAALPNPAATVTFTINISPTPIINHAPTTNLPIPQTIEAGTPLVFSNATGNPITVSDPDGFDQVLQLIIEAPPGSQITLPDSDALITETATGVQVLLQDPIADINQALDGLTYLPPDGFTGSLNLNFRVDDNLTDGSPAVLQALTVNVTAPNPGPTDPGPTDPGPTDPGPTDGSGSEVPGSTGPKLVSTAQDGLMLEGGTGSGNLSFTLLNHNSSNPVEIVLFQTDDASGSINGIAPSDAGYVSAVTGQSVVIFSTLGDDDLDGAFAALRTLSIEGSGTYNFAIVQNGTLDSFLTDPASGATITFGNTTANASGFDLLDLEYLSSEDAFILNFDLDGDGLKDDLSLKADLGNSAPPLGAGLQGDPQSELFDLRDITGPVQVSFSIAAEATFKNQVGFYAVDNANGQITDEFGVTLTPGDTGYAEAAARQGLNNDRLTQSQSNVTFTMEGGKIYVPFLVVDGTIEDLFDADITNDPALYFPFIGANSDGVDHVKLLGDNTFGFEDLMGGGDLDYDDFVLQAQFQVA